MTIELEEAASLQSIIDAAAEHAPAQTKSAKNHKQEIANAIDQGDIDTLMALNDVMNTLMTKIVGNKIDMDNLGEFTEEELESVMLEHINAETVKRLIDVRYSMRREAIFAHITEMNKKAGKSDPEHTPGEAPVVKLGKKFTREGGKLKARLDEDKLRGILGEDTWLKISQEVEYAPVEARVELELDETKLLSLVKTDPSVLEKMKDCIIPGGYGSSKLMLREISKK
jgi:hypothetical protein